MDILITYDIKTEKTGEPKNKEVKDRMKKLNYFDSFKYNEKTYYLPNTSLWKKNTTAESAKTELLNAAKACGAVVERLFATQFTNWAAIPGEDFK